ncbi:protein chain elongation factor EF-Ts [Gammaproteobacteria bacterium]
MQITAAMVKELRERTGSGMMECKKALTEANGDIDAAVEAMRKAGLAKADKRAGRVAAEGRVIIKVDAGGRRAVMVEVNCETDFVARGDDFQGFVEAVANKILEIAPANLEALSNLSLGSDGSSVEQVRQALVAKIGENMAVRRFTVLDSDAGRFATYLHGTRIGVVVEMTGGSVELGKDIAMHVAASRPVCVSPDLVPAELVAKEREIFTAMSVESGKGKSPAIIEKMVEGRVRKFLDEVALTGQPFVKDLNMTVGKLLATHKAAITRFVRYEVGEGIEKKSVDFAAEVMAQVQGG